MLLGGHVRAVFTLITVIFVICVSYTVTSFREIPLNILEITTDFEPPSDFEEIKKESEEDAIDADPRGSYGSINDPSGTKVR